MAKREEMVNDFDAWFVDYNTWGMSRKQLIDALFTPGNDPGDVVATFDEGHVMTRHIANHWLTFCDAAKVGWNASQG